MPFQRTLYPAKRSDFQNPQFWNDTTINKWSAGVEAEVEALDYSISPGFEHGTLQPNYLKAIYSDALMNCIHAVVTEEVDIETAVATYLSFNEVLAYGSPKFVRLGNYIYLARDPVFWNAFKNVLVWTFGIVSLQVLWGLATALTLNEPFSNFS
jgi:hypothetical protein